MSNDSTSSGYITPTGDAPLYDSALEQSINNLIQEITGLSAELVFIKRPIALMQIPQNDVTCCAFDITSVQYSANPAYVQVSDAAGEQWSQEILLILCCFYGANGAGTAALLRDGLYVSQNSAELNRIGLSFQECGPIFNRSEIINEQWNRRYDIDVKLRRKIIRSHNIESLLAAPVSFFGE